MIRLPVHVVIELLCGSQPIAPTCVVWSWHFKDSPWEERVFYTRVFPSHWLIAMPCWWAPNSWKKTGVHGCHCPRDMAVRMREVMARLWVGVCVPLLYFSGNSWSTFPTHVVIELLCSSQPTAPTCVVWSWRLIDCFALTLAVRSFWDAGLPRSLTQQLCHAGGPHYWQNSCLWLPLHAWYGSAHVWGTGAVVGWCFGAPCFKFALFSMQLN